MTHEHAEGRIETSNGESMWFEVRGRGEPLLALHGFSGSGKDWESLPAEWMEHFRLIVPDLRGHGRSSTLSKPFRHLDAASDLVALLDHLEVKSVSGIGISGGGNVLLHLATRQPERVKAMVLVSATPYFPEKARGIMRGYANSLTSDQLELLRSKHARGDEQVQALLESATAFAESYDDMTFTPPHLGTIQARTLIVQGDRDPLYPMELSVEMARAIPNASLWIVPNAGHGAVFGPRWPEFLKTAEEFLRQ